MAFVRLRDAAWFRSGVGASLAIYLQAVWRSNRFVIEPADFYERVASELPVIITMWHGQHFMAPFLRRPEHRVKALVSWHRDAEINAIAAERLGTGTIRGSGDHEGRFDRKGGVRAFIAMRDALADGCNVMMTADVPKVARVAGRGVVLLARASGRPIYPVGMATSRRITLNNWDKSAISLPFGRGAIVVGDAVRVPARADDATLEHHRRAVESALNAATARAYALVDAAGEHPGA